VQYWVSVLIAIYGAALLAFSRKCASHDGFSRSELTPTAVCGWLADQTSSRRSPLLIGLLALLASTVLLNVGNKTPILVVGRILQGASAAVV
jgi:MFS family permease